MGNGAGMSKVRYDKEHATLVEHCETWVPGPRWPGGPSGRAVSLLCADLVLQGNLAMTG